MRFDHKGRHHQKKLLSLFDIISLFLVDVYGGCRFAQQQYSSCSGSWAGDECSVVLERCEPGEAITFGRDGMNRPMVYMVTIDTKENKAVREKTLARFQSVIEENGVGPLEIVPVIAAKQENSKELRRVASWVRHRFSVIIPTNILHSSDMDVVKYMIGRQSMVQSDELQAEPQYIPRVGEIYVRAAFRKALMKALDSPDEYFVIVEDDVVPSNNFMNELSAVMENGCGRYMSRYTGVLMLGSSDWGDESHWSVIDEAVEKDQSMCHDAHSRSYGAFAVLYNRNAAKMILREMDRWPNIPYDHIFYRLAMRGAFVSVAYPNLVVVDHWNKSSNVNQAKWQKEEGEGMEDPNKEMNLRIERHRWDMGRYKWSATTTASARRWRRWLMGVK